MPSMLNFSKIFFISIIFFLLVNFVNAQVQTDNNLIYSKQDSSFKFSNKRKVTYLFANKNAFVKYNPVSLILGGLLFTYQKYISKQIGAACPYEISCSAFGMQCIQQYGLLKGIPLTADRLTRCTRAASMDFVPGVDFNTKTQRVHDHPNDYRFNVK